MVRRPLSPREAQALAAAAAESGALAMAATAALLNGKGRAH